MILTDTGYWLALTNSKDRYHQHAISVSSTLNEDPITTWPVISEAYYLIQREVGTSSARRFLNFLHQQDIEIFALESAHFPRLDELTGKYSDLPMDLADASLVLLAEKVGHGRILSTDQRDFNAYRWKNHYPFENLLLG